MKIRSSLRISGIAVVMLFSPIAAAQTPPAPPTSPASPTPSTPPAPVTPAAPPEKVYLDSVVKIGDTRKQTRGRVTDVDKGDNGCFITFRDEKNNEFIEIGKFALCTQKPPLKGRRVEMTYAMETIQAGDCYGDPKCKRTETVPVITAVNVVE